MAEVVVVSFTESEVSAILSALEATFAFTIVPAEDDTETDESAGRDEDKLQLKFGRRAIAKLARAVKKIQRKGCLRRSKNRDPLKTFSSSFML